MNVQVFFTSLINSIQYRLTICTSTVCSVASHYQSLPLCSWSANKSRSQQPAPVLSYFYKGSRNGTKIILGSLPPPSLFMKTTAKSDNDDLRPIDQLIVWNLISFHANATYTVQSYLSTSSTIFEIPKKLISSSDGPYLNFGQLCADTEWQLVSVLEFEFSIIA